MTSSLYGADLFSADAARDDIAVQVRFAARRKSLKAGVALLLLLGPFGAHRFYAGRMGGGAAILLATMLSAGCLAAGNSAASTAGSGGLLAVAVWCLVELGLLPCLIAEYNRRLMISLGH